MDAELRDELDEDIHDLRALLTESAPRPSTASLPSAGPSRIGPPVAESDGNGDLDANYDQFVRELAYDARAKPKNRTKTQEEMAVEEKELLEKAEARRLRRMRGEASGDEDEDGEGAGGRAKRRKTKKSRGDADDLDDDFEEDLLGPGLTREDIENMRDEQEDEDDDEEDDDGEGDDDEDQDEDEDEDEDEERDEDEEVSEMEDLDDEAPELISVDEDDFESGLVRKSKAKAATKGKTREIPYTFPCPANIEEFEDILEGLGDEALPTVVQRIRALHHPSLAQGNKEKLQVSPFHSVLHNTLIRAGVPWSLN
jgi:nucleolar protein 14